MATTSPTETTGERVVVLNPVSGAGDHPETVREHAEDYGYDVLETEEEGDAIELTRDAIGDGATEIAAAGGDGTLNGVVRGVVEAEALDDVTVGVLPCGTGNDFAANVGVTGIEQGFEVLEAGERRRIDLGFADGDPFVNSCVGGLTAESSAETSPALKDQFGTFAYVVETLRAIPSFDGIRLTARLSDADADAPVWSGTAIAVLIGNGRRFPPSGSTQANMEDGRFDVTLVHGTGSVDLMETAAVERLLGRESDQTSRYTVSGLEIEVQEADPVSFSLDGEIIERHELSVRNEPRALTFAVGERYEPIPGGEE
ncbi:diacylglycerol/lipid kinase family protein [Haloarcula nitratireducens]|uniref:Diacylglycerol kinase family lipid kinase n=1 Tax=Haloarcula nitratireducens TaxID=2487749 RepID=A0AAW4PF08_9EURY|nr:diacylglycerol kinase family protein [Halomicroarcula nitratireducens]MBX0296201.1 diacylglycerol kinase family lipid kinase [Halomicroarcula nitratireducens]